MEYKLLGRSNLKISNLGIGALHFGIFCNKKQTKEIIDYAYDKGINFIDTAPLYGNGNSELYINEAIKNKRDKFILGTKIGLKINKKNDFFGVEVMKLNKKNIENSLNLSLKSLGTDYIDILQLHAFDNKTNIEETLTALKELQKKGKIREIGCSNYNPKELQMAIAASKKIGIPFVTSQMHYNMIERKVENRIIPLCNKNNIMPVSYRTLARGILASKYKQNTPISKNTRAYKSFRVRKLLTNELFSIIKEIEKFSLNYAKNLSQFSIAWLLNKKNNVILLGVRDIKQLNDNLESVNITISDEIYDNLEKIIKDNSFDRYINNMPEVYFEK